MSDIVKKPSVTSLALDPALGEIDISHLPIETQNELQKYVAMKKIDLQASIHKTQRDLQATSTAVENMSDITRKMSNSGDSVTIKQTIENSAGRTEIVMGNTTEADRGGSSWLNKFRG